MLKYKKNHLYYSVKLLFRQYIFWCNYLISIKYFINKNISFTYLKSLKSKKIIGDNKIVRHYKVMVIVLRENVLYCLIKKRLINIA